MNAIWYSLCYSQSHRDTCITRGSGMNLGQKVLLDVAWAKTSLQEGLMSKVEQGEIKHKP